MPYRRKGGLTSAQGASAYLPQSPNQRGAWAALTAYAIGDMVINPNGDLVVPKVAFTSGAAYVAGNWNIIVPAQTAGKELAAASVAVDTTLTGDGSFHDLAGLTMTVPAGIAWTAFISGVMNINQGTAGATTTPTVEVKLVDSATGLVEYGYARSRVIFPATSGIISHSLTSMQRNDPLASSTLMKLQLKVPTISNMGTVGFVPASLGGQGPTTIQAVGR
jgi:hypothetical protein